LAAKASTVAMLQFPLLHFDISKSKAMKKAKCSSMASSSGNWSIVTMHGLAANTK
jgi:hypothetical protein